jgi:hypothetical protein
MNALGRRINQTGAIPAESFEESAAVAAVLGTRSLIAWIEGPEPAIRPKIRSVPQSHQSKHARLNASLPGFAIAFEQMQSFEPLESPEWEIDLDAVWIEDFPVEIAIQSFAYESWLILEFQPARIEFKAVSAAEAPLIFLPEVMPQGMINPEAIPPI